MTSRVLIATAAGLVGTLLCGCGDDRPYSGPAPNQGGGYSASAPPPLASAPATQAPPLLSGGEAISTEDPLLPHGKQAPRDPLAQNDPLQGRTMPTDHSHWLRGQVHGAQVTVLLNGIREGVYSGPVDRDITMKLRRGVNSVSFVYVPGRTDASAQMDLLESEHDPPIPPLAQFQSVAASSGSEGLKPAMQTVMFVAK